MAYSSSSSSFPSCQFRLIPLVSIFVGFLLLMASNVASALECYKENVPANESLSLGEVVAFGVPANGGNGTMHCPAGYPHCLALHCRGRYGADKMIKTCARYQPGTTTAEEACNYYRDKEFCGDDPKYYCRYCDTDLCNNEPDDE